MEYEMNRLKEDSESFGENWEDVTNEFKERVESCLAGCERDGFSLDYVARVKPKTRGMLVDETTPQYVVHLYAGRNSCSNWGDYFADAISIVYSLTSSVRGKFKRAWLIEWTNDPADDVSSLLFGVC